MALLTGCSAQAKKMDKLLEETILKIQKRCTQEEEQSRYLWQQENTKATMLQAQHDALKEQVLLAQREASLNTTENSKLAEIIEDLEISFMHLKDERNELESQLLECKALVAQLQSTNTNPQVVEQLVQKVRQKLPSEALQEFANDKLATENFFNVALAMVQVLEQDAAVEDKQLQVEDASIGSITNNLLPPPPVLKMVPPNVHTIAKQAAMPAMSLNLPTLPCAIPSRHVIAVPIENISKFKVSNTAWITSGIIDMIQQLDLNTSELETLFAAEQATESKPITLLELQKHNVLVELLSTTNISHDLIRDAILTMDNSLLQASFVTMLAAHAPTLDDIHAIATYDGDVEQLSNADKFILTVSVFVN